jgi:amino acid transporter
MVASSLKSWWTRVMNLKEIIFGRRLRSEEEESEQLGTLTGIPVLGLDALSSAAYGPEAALTVLIALGTLASGYIIPITGIIIALLIAVAMSYRQTIPAYPGGGGSFTVAKENLGPVAGLFAASALCIDYVLNVAVAISAGVAALVSALPPLLPFTLPLCLLILVVLAIVNLRGIRTAGLLFIFPTYLFVACLGIVVTIGVVKTIIAHGHPLPVISPPQIPISISTVSIWLLVRAFASGCTALTGVEAVSNAVPIFRQPTTTLAKRTLTIIIMLLALLLAGVAFLSHSYGISATPPGQAGYQSILSQIIAAVTGRGVFYYVSIASVLLVLALSSNTSFTDFPRVCRLLALDEYLPAEFAHRGRRLVFTEGICLLTVLSGVLLVVYGGITDRLIPLFAVGAFTAFTLSQAGMVLHWHRSEEPNAKWSLTLNAIGAVATAVTLVILAVSKFTEGAWISILVIPPIVMLFARIRHYHQEIYSETIEIVPLDVKELTPPIIVVPLKQLSSIARKGLRLAMSLSSEVHVVQVVAEEMNTDDLLHLWNKLVSEPTRQAGKQVPVLSVIRSPYREFFGPLLRYINKLALHHPDRQLAVVIPELVEVQWYNLFLRHRATLLKTMLRLQGNPQIVIITTPWYRKETHKKEKAATAG